MNNYYEPPVRSIEKQGLNFFWFQDRAQGFYNAKLWIIENNIE